MASDKSGTAGDNDSIHCIYDLQIYDVQIYDVRFIYDLQYISHLLEVVGALLSLLVLQDDLAGW